MNQEIVLFGLSQYGLRETPGEGDNAAILEMAKQLGIDNYYHDSIAWCSLFMNFCAFKTGYQRSGKLNARSWLDVGTPVIVPEMGDVAILWRGSKDGWEGHVGILIKVNSGVPYLLAGNQGDMVSIEGFNPNRVLGYRRLNKI